MAKTSKTTKRTTSAKRKGIFSKINLSSPKTRFVAAILLVAVMGGGWFTYRSFAATPTNIYVQCTPSNCLNAKTLGVNAFNATDSNKNNMPMYRLAKGGEAYTKSLTIPGNATLQYCATVRADKAVTINAGIGFTNRGGVWDIKATTGWTDVCGDNQGPFGSALTGGVLSVSNPTSVNVYVAKIFVKTDSKPAPSTPVK